MSSRWASDLVGTKKAAFAVALLSLSAASVTAARTATFPDASGTVALLDISQTWSALSTQNFGAISADSADLGGTQISTLLVTRPGFVTQAYLQSDIVTRKAELYFSNSGGDRWALVKDAVAESGGNAGQSLYLEAFDDAGASLGNVFTIARATRVLNFVVAPTFTGVESTVRGNLGLGTVATHADTEFVHTTGTESVGGVKTYTSNAFFNAALTVDGGLLSLDRSGDATTANFLIDRDAGQIGQITFRTAGSDRWIIRINATGESGSNAGSNYEFLARDDAGGSLGSVFTVTRATRVLNFTVAPTFSDVATTRSNLSLGTADSVTFAAVTVNAGNLNIDRVGDAATGQLLIDLDAGALGRMGYRTGTAARWYLEKETTAESGADAGSGLRLRAFSDAGASLGDVFTVDRADRILDITVGATVPNTAIGNASTTVPNTNFVNDALNRALTAQLLRAA